MCKVCYFLCINDERYKKLNKQKLENDYSEAVILTGEELKQYSYGQKVYIIPYKNYLSHGHLVGKLIKKIMDNQENVEDEDRYRCGYFYKGEVPSVDGKTQTNKHFESVFVEKEDKSTPIVIDEEQIEQLRTIYKIYNDKGINKNLAENGCYYKDFLRKLEEADTILPVWYNHDTGKLSLACIGRIVYNNRAEKFLKEKKPCTDRRLLCKACRLFGTAKEEGKEGIGS